jgi:TetR/AcrR family transcriptional repressor of nem operon
LVEDVSMGRPRSFDEHSVIVAANKAFTNLGYEATSVDDLLQATGLHRGSLYQAFGSKRGLFLAALRAHLLPAANPTAAAHGPADEKVEPPGAPSISPARSAADGNDETLLDLLLVATLELAPRDEEVRSLVERALVEQADPEHAAALLGRRLLARAHINLTQPSRTD